MPSLTVAGLSPVIGSNEVGKTRDWIVKSGDNLVSGKLNNIFMNLMGRSGSKSNLDGSRGHLLNVGFHGDKYILGLVEEIAKNISIFVETGTNLGSTSCYMARRYPHIKVYTCEADANAYIKARAALSDYPNAYISKMKSPEYLYCLHQDLPELKSASALYWLDAHGYGFRWPLLYEISFLTANLSKGFILIDDFKVPGRPEFKYDRYDGQECSLEYIDGSLANNKKYIVMLPDYSEYTSEFHPLTGVCLLVFGVDVSSFSAEILSGFAISKIEK